MYNTSGGKVSRVLEWNRVSTMKENFRKSGKTFKGCTEGKVDARWKAKRKKKINKNH